MGRAQGAAGLHRSSSADLVRALTEPAADTCGKDREWSQNMVPRSSPPAFDPGYVSEEETQSTSLQTPAGNSTPHCPPAPTCGAEAAETVPVLPSEAEEASRLQSALGLVPHRAAPSVPAALAFSHDDVVQNSLCQSKSPVEGSICAQVSVSAALFCRWPRHKSSPPRSELLLKLPATSLTHCVVYWMCNTRRRRVVNGCPGCACSPGHLGCNLPSGASPHSGSDGCGRPRTADSPCHHRGHTHDP